MTLKDWLENEDHGRWDVASIADRCEVSRATVYAWIDGTNLPLLENFAVLEGISGGRVKVASLVQVHRKIETDKKLKRLAKQGEAA